MSRSRKKTPIHGNAFARSEKEDKKLLHGVERANERQVLNKILKEEVDFDEATFYTTDEALNLWDMAKDGKNYWEKQARYSYRQEWWDEYREKAMRK